MGKHACSNCRNWRRLDDTAGECHALPPPAATTPAKPGPGAKGKVRRWAVWPLTVPDDVCGSWCPLPVRPQAPPEEVSPAGDPAA